MADRRNDARHICDRRRHGRADAGASGDGARRDGGRDRRWPEARLGKVAIPAVCLTDPEIVSVGLSPEAARKAGIEIKTGLFPFQANGRAMTLENEGGFIRVVARADNHLPLGLQACRQSAPRSRSYSAAFSWALEMARGSRTSQRPFTSIRPRAKPCSRPLSRPWAIRFISYPRL